MRRGVAAGLFDVIERHRPEKPSKTPMIMPGEGFARHGLGGGEVKSSE